VGLGLPTGDIAKCAVGHHPVPHSRGAGAKSTNILRALHFLCFYITKYGVVVQNGAAIASGGWWGYKNVSVGVWGG
jgi:hypothetical protein